MPSIRTSKAVSPEEVVRAFREHFKCRRCGDCCAAFDGVKLTKAEMKRLAVPKNERSDTFMLIDGTYYMKEPCRFYDAEKSECTIYDTRPETCRNFPLRAVNCTAGLIYLDLSRLCPAAAEALEEVEAEWTGR